MGSVVVEVMVDDIVRRSLTRSVGLIRFTGLIHFEVGYILTF